MISAEQITNTNIVDLHAEAPLKAEDFASSQPVLERVTREHDTVSLLITVESLGMMTPAALWGDQKLAEYVDDLGRIAVISEVVWYAQLIEVAEALPGLTLERFEPEQRGRALEWLGAGSPNIES